MSTLNDTQHQTISANANKLHALAQWYAELSAGHSIAAGHGQEQAHRIMASDLGAIAGTLTKWAKGLERALELKREEAARPSIEKVKP